METFTCHCGNTLFFENTQCVSCNSEVGWCPACHRISGLLVSPDGIYHCGYTACQALLVKCHNYAVEQVCNRCFPAGNHNQSVTQLCDYCRYNDTIPDLSVEGNRERWYRLETGKRRLLFTLDLLGLPYGKAGDGIQPALSFDFKADVHPSGNQWHTMGDHEQVFTGHHNGKITINLREAEDVEREKLRVSFGEAHRTIIGHFRHEIAHYYWEMLIQDKQEEEFNRIFGDYQQPTYAQALERHYREGPPSNWQARFISVYATMHPWEDFAETFAKYLAIVSVLDTARYTGIGEGIDPAKDDIAIMIRSYQRLGLGLNEMNRAMGLLDLMPEVLVPPVIEKLQYIHQIILEARSGGSTRSVTRLPT
ncbi:putative zinc-binding metallopeptidase [uncultured Nitrospira sp.]|uniref:zinc-binding metallopeptidase family protein n=1 Tax=uncultured Nitrospira sp. TaxID=157176 RepID=UPI00314015D8